MTPTQIASLVNRRVWLMIPEVLHAMLAAMQRRQAGNEPEREAATQPQSKSAGGIAVLPIHGVIEQRWSWMMDWFGGTSTDEFGAMYDAAMADPKVKGIIVDIDSPGGTVPGVQELSEKIFAARGQKPVVAVANSMAASAAYWIGSAFDKLFVAPGGSVGSVGVYSVHMDYSARMEQDGVKPTIFQVPEYKAEFNPFQPLTDEAKEHEQREIERIYADFVSSVARNRGTTGSNVKAVYGKGRVIDAKQAVDLGMADRVATLDKVIQRMQAGAFKPGSPLQASADWDVTDDWKARNETERLKVQLWREGWLSKNSA